MNLLSALDRKYSNAAISWEWQYVFPSSRLSRDPRAERTGRHHASEDILQASLKAAVQQVGIVKRVSCHTLRHSFATHLLETNYDIRTIQELLGHKDVRADDNDLHARLKARRVESARRTIEIVYIVIQ